MASALLTLMLRRPQVARGCKYISSYKLPQPNITIMCQQHKIHDIERNISKRKGKANIPELQQLLQKIKANGVKHLDNEEVAKILSIPNLCHPDILEYPEEGKIIKTVESKEKRGYKLKTFDELVGNYGLLRTDRLSHVTGYRTYYLQGSLAELEQALVRYTVAKLLKKKFSVISVPDLLHSGFIEGCGMKTEGPQIYHIDKPELSDICLSGTSEMALGGFLSDRYIEMDELPTRLASVSRCYRAETSSTEEKKGAIYRVHQFTKVEMFGICEIGKSDLLLEEFLQIQQTLFEDLDLEYQVVDMPPCELGPPAYRKFDIEAKFPGSNIYGEISSCSNCTDYQSLRLNITCRSKEYREFVHTVNGTACAVPRMLVALVETHQDSQGQIHVPPALQPFMEDTVLQICQPLKNIVKLKYMKANARS